MCSTPFFKRSSNNQPSVSLNNQQPPYVQNKPNQILKDQQPPSLNKPTQETTCVSCQDYAPNYILIPCGHPHMCVECHKKWLATNNSNKCSICKTDITKFQVVFL